MYKNTEIVTMDENGANMTIVKIAIGGKEKINGKNRDRNYIVGPFL